MANRNQRYLDAIESLASSGVHVMKVTGQSMKPKIQSGSVLSFQKTDDYQKGDVVFCLVGSRYIDAHLITKVADDGRFMISNNHGHDNGWTRKIFGRVVKVNGESFGRSVERSD